MKVLIHGGDTLLAIECPDCKSVLEFSRAEIIRDSTDYLGDKNPPYIVCPVCKETITEQSFPIYKYKGATT